MGLPFALVLAVVGVLGPPHGRSQPRPESVVSPSGFAPAARLVQQVQFDPSRFDSTTANTLRSIIDAAAEIGLPTGPLINRALQGAGMGKKGTQIVSAVRAYAAALSDAREVLGPKSKTDELEAGASAIRAGVDMRTLEAMRATRPDGSVVMPLTVLTDVLQRGIPPASARDAITAIARMPNSDRALEGLRAMVAKNSVRGPGMALDAMNRYVRGTVPAGALPPPVTPDRKPPIRPPNS